ncbi:hypothetical protein FB561_4865 [Kribbella amoyensis]|uniref:DUF554 domain-containing protein n=1 Tax=Kribbella amoyensis TaxID=996641 RepID=A0A561BXS3_9ACTN|nr:DUF554 domain-containing protein [Kribbella amoyensis]TWD83696.1 hypothetical protein FB561_4865 [Kribbella amoyensis]
MFIGIGTVVNVATVLVGSVLGVLIGHRLPQRTRDLVTDALGLVTLLIAITSALAVGDQVLSAAVGGSAPILIVLGAMLIGGIAGSLLRIEQRLEDFGGWMQRRFSRGESTFVEGFVTASMVFCVGPLTFLGSLSDGLGRGADQLLLKSVLDGFASIAFAASLGWGVAASALVVLVVQGLMTLVGALLGDVLPEAHVTALGATGGLLLIGVALRLLKLKQVAVADMLPALIVAPLLVQLLIVVRG